MATVDDLFLAAVGHQQNGRLQAAVELYRQILAMDARRADALPQFHFNLGVALASLGRREGAIASYRRGIQVDPGNTDLRYNLGNALYAQGDLAGAISQYRQVAELQPAFAEAVYNQAIALGQLGQPQESLDCYRRAVELRPDWGEAHHNLANLAHEMGDCSLAVTHYRRAIELRPSMAAAHCALGNLLQEQGAYDEAIVCHRQAITLQPNYPIAVAALAHDLEQVCLWEELPALADRVIDAVEIADATGTTSGVSPFAFLTLVKETSPVQQLHCARQWAARQFRPAAVPAYGPRRPDKSKITIGYLSSDYHYHATAMLIAELFERHDRGRFNVVGYSYGRPDDSALRRRIVAGLDRLVDLRQLSDADAARRIAADDVDILVDLKGYTAGARTQILAERPAPIQVNYLGYPGTMGASFIDYILVDDFIAPPDQQPAFSEKLVHLPGCYQVNDSRREISSRTPSRLECGLPDGAFVFCSFNSNYKITPDVFAVWTRLLQAIPESVLWLLEGNPTAVANLRREAASRNVPADRLIFAPRLPLDEHLARHRLADLFLDTFPVNAHTTASEALWAGCPLVTLAGQTLISRVAGSLLRALDMTELIATEIARYEQIVLELAHDRARLAKLRARLASVAPVAALFDGGKFASGIERAYETMWSRRAAGQPPTSFRVG